MGDHEIKAIHGHRERNGKREFLVEWEAIEFAKSWDFVERHNMKCAELLKAYNKRVDQKKYWEKMLEAGYLSLQRDLEIAASPPGLPTIVDFRAQEPPAESVTSLPMIMNESQQAAISTCENQQQQQQPTCSQVVVKNIFKKKLDKDVPHFLCEMTDGLFVWILITDIKDKKKLENFYIINHIIQTETKIKAGEIYLDDGDDDKDTDGAPSRKRRKGFATLSTSTTGKISTEVEQPESSSTDDTSKNIEPDGFKDSHIKCVYCLMPFCTKSAMSDHMRNHFKYPCHWCGKKLNWRSLSTHVESVHKLTVSCCCVCASELDDEFNCPLECKAKKRELVIKMAARE